MAEVLPATVRAPRDALWTRVRRSLPQGLELPKPMWDARHRTVLWVLALQAVGLALFGISRGWDPVLSVIEGGVIGLLALLASVQRLSRRFRGAVASLGCVTSSAVLVQFSGGVIEAHFHFFVMVALVALYQDWVPFLLAILYVAVDHGLIGSLAPQWVYNHADAILHPWKWAAIHAAMVLAECGALIAFWGGAEQAKTRSDLVLDSAGEGIIGLGLDHRIAFINRSGSTLLGRPADILVALPLDQFLSDTHGKAIAFPAPLRHGEATPARVAVEGILKHEDGSSLPVEWIVTPTLRVGAMVGYVVTLRDITERRKAEEERIQQVAAKRQVEKLLEQDRFKTQLLNTASHELNTPISALRLQLHLLKSHLPPGMDERSTRGFQVLDRNVERLGALVRDTLDVARIEGGRLQLKPAATDLGRLATDTVQSLEGLGKEKQITLAVTTQPTPLTADPGRLTQVLFNLVANAIRFTPVGGTVEVSTGSDGQKAWARVHDSGVGIDPDQIKLLFQPFSQLHDGQLAPGGTGLGLYISRGIIEQHGGRIWCESAGAGTGSLFSFEVPLTPIEAAATPAAGQGRAAS